MWGTEVRLSSASVHHTTGRGELPACHQHIGRDCVWNFYLLVSLLSPCQALHMPKLLYLLVVWLLWTSALCAIIYIT